MCGLVGLAANDINIRIKDTFRDMLIMDSVRGVHGTGVAGIDRHNTVEVAKRAGHVFDLLDHKSFDRAVTLSKHVLIGHNRHATRGAHTHYNAHPFGFKNIVGAHNGTVPYQTAAKLPGAQYYDTDSEAIIDAMDVLLGKGAKPEEAVKEVLSSLDGAWALTMFFRQTKQVGLIRNTERPLYYCYAEDRSLLFWASEAWILYSAIARNNLKIDEDETSKIKVFALPEDSLLLWDLPKTNTEKFGIPYRTKIEGKKTPAVISHWENEDSFFRGSAGAQSRTSYNNSGSQTTISTVIGRSQSPKKEYRFPNDNKNGHYKPPYKTYDGRVLKKDEFENLIKLGHSCLYCNHHTPTYGEECLFVRPAPTGAPQFVCKNCVKDPEVMEIVRAIR